MTDKGDKRCPLCTEVMDLTDQQLKPCTCGYEICVWCWNRIMEMAMDYSKGCCPGCRAPYDKEKIIGMSANCERLVAEINTERKLKSHKVKPKLSEGRMHLSNVRVIKRNLVYIIGLPLNLADEALLQRREYFGRYGKVSKVSISKTASGVIQHSSNNSCCVYITYLKEEEAVRCIQSVHSFVLDGKPLRACFGTTKYCHAWLKNLPCSIPDCLYLHEFGSEEDSFMKDDLVSAFTRSRVQQIIGATNNTHHSGNVLPPPADEYSDKRLSLMTKFDCNSPLNQSNADYDKGSHVYSGAERSHVDGSTERSNVNPGEASRVKRISSNMPAAKSLSGSNGNIIPRPEIASNPHVFPSEAEIMKRSNDTRTAMAEGSCEVDPTLSLSAVANSCAVSNPVFMVPDEDRNIMGACSALTSARISNHLGGGNTCGVVMDGSAYNGNPSMSQGSEKVVSHLQIESPASSPVRKSSHLENLLDLDDQEIKDSEGNLSLPSISCLSSSMQYMRLSDSHSRQEGETNQKSDINRHSISAPRYDETAISSRPCKPGLRNGFFDNKSGNGLPDLVLEKCLKKCDAGEAGADSKVAPDIGESSIISSILSMDMDTWEDTLASPQTLFGLLTESDKQHKSFIMPNVRKAPESFQSRFSFARQDDLNSQESNSGRSFDDRTNSSYVFNHHNEKDLSIARHNDLSSYGGSVNSIGSLGNHPSLTSKFSVSKIPSSPPGFSLQSRAVPPGYPTRQAINYDENHLMRNTLPASTNVGSYLDFDFTDPAITEIGGHVMATRLKTPSSEVRPAMSPRVNPLNHDTQFQMPMQLPASVKQNYMFSDHFTNRFPPQNDVYGISSLLLGESPPNNASPFSPMTPDHVRNMHMPRSRWVGWDDMKSSHNLGVSELLMNGRTGFNKITPSTGNLKYQRSGSSNIYNRGFAL